MYVPTFFFLEEYSTSFTSPSCLGAILKVWLRKTCVTVHQKMATDSKSVGTQKKVHGDVEDDKDLFTRNRKKFYRKSQAELIVGYVVHFVLLAFYVFVRVYEATVIKRMSKESYDVAFSGAKLYGGRWKYLTYIDLVRDRQTIRVHTPHPHGLHNQAYTG